MAAKKWNKVILFGDSLTQRALEPSGCWGSLLANRLQRVSDVIVRGFIGYNSRYLRAICPNIFGDTIDAREVSCVTLLLGANDSHDKDSAVGLHVPIDEFADNLAAIVHHLEAIGISKDRILVISPPIHDQLKRADFCRQNGIPLMGRDNQIVGKYAEECGRVALKCGVQFIDLYQYFSGQQNPEELLCDGLHFSPIGSQLFFDLIWPSIEKRVKDYNKSSELIPNYPHFLDIDPMDWQKSFVN